MKIYDFNLINHLTNMIKTKANYVDMAIHKNSTKGNIDVAINELDRLNNELTALKGIGENIDERM